MLWDALTKDRRFAGHGFKRQVPVGPHIADLVSFPLRLVIELVPETRARRRPASGGAARLAHGARLPVVVLQSGEIESDCKCRRARIEAAA